MADTGTGMHRDQKAVMVTAPLRLGSSEIRCAVVKMCPSKEGHHGLPDHWCGAGGVAARLLSRADRTRLPNPRGGTRSWHVFPYLPATSATDFKQQAAHRLDGS